MSALLLVAAAACAATAAVSGGGAGGGGGGAEGSVHATLPRSFLFSVCARLFFFLGGGEGSLHAAISTLGTVCVSCAFAGGYVLSAEVLAS